MTVEPLVMCWERDLDDEDKTPKRLSWFTWEIVK
jgi:hypothetical protein